MEYTLWLLCFGFIVCVHSREIPGLVSDQSLLVNLSGHEVPTDNDRRDSRQPYTAEGSVNYSPYKARVAQDGDQSLQKLYPFGRLTPAMTSTQMHDHQRQQPMVAYLPVTYMPAPPASRLSQQDPYRADLAMKQHQDPIERVPAEDNSEDAVLPAPESVTSRADTTTDRPPREVKRKCYGCAEVVCRCTNCDEKK